MPFVSIINKPQDLLRIPKFPSEIKSIDIDDDDGFIKYTFTVEVDVPEAIAKGITYIGIEVLPHITNPPKPTKPNPAQSALDFIANTTSTELTAAEYAQQVARSVLARKKVRFNPWKNAPSNSSMPKLGEIPEFRQDDANKMMSPGQKFVRTKMPFEGMLNIIPPIPPSSRPLEIIESKTKGPQQDRYNPRVPQSIGINNPGFMQDKRKVFKNVLQAGKDPASLTAATPVVNILGSSPLSNAVSKILYVPPFVAPPPEMYFFQPKFTKREITVSIRKELLDDLSTFYVRTSLWADKVRNTEYEIFSVPHSRLVNAYLTPTKKPQLGAAYLKPGKVAVEVRQTDEKASSIKVFRRLSPATDGTNKKGTGWEKIFDTPMTMHDKVTFTDEIMYSGQIIYRAISYGSNGKPSEEFASKVLRPITKAPITTALTANARYVEQSHNSHVEIRVTDIPPGEDITAIRLQRFDITYDSARLRKQNKGMGFVYVGNPQNVLVVSDIEATFIDTTAESGRTYRYLPMGLSPTVGTVYGVPYVLEIPAAIGDPALSINITSPKSVGGPSSTDIEIELSGEFTDFGFKKVQETLSAVGQDRLYNDQIDKNRSEFGKLISFKVVRENLTNGDAEDFGIIEPGTFRDDAKTRDDRGISTPEAGIEYAYSVTAVINTPDYLFPRILKTEVDKNTLNIVKKTLSTLSSPMTKMGGVIPSTAKQYDVNANDKIFPQDPRMAGVTNIQEKLSYVFIEPTNTIKDVNVEEFKDFNRISWVFDGNLTRLDHFRISLQSGGGSVIIDTVHCDPSISRFFYRHKDIGYAVDYQYEITPVDLAYNDVQSITTNIVAASIEGVVKAAAASSALAKQTFNFPADIEVLKL